jgi:hypothetical protein
MNTHNLNRHTVRKQIELPKSCSPRHQLSETAEEAGILRVCHPPYLHRQALKGPGLKVPSQKRPKGARNMKTNHKHNMDSLPAGSFLGDSIPAGTFHGDSIPAGTFHGDSIPAGTFH